MQKHVMMLAVLFGATLLFFGCGNDDDDAATGDTGTDTSGDTDTDSDSDADTDTDSDVDTGEWPDVADDHPFGTVTADDRMPGHMDCKGNCNYLQQGGYMRFDLSGYEEGTQISEATLSYFALHTAGTTWSWVTLIQNDPHTAPVETVFAEIEDHAILITTTIYNVVFGWGNRNLNATGVAAINQALAQPNPEDRWIAMALTFE